MRLVSIGDSIEPMGYALAFPFRAASTDVFSRAVTAALYGGTMTAYRARYRIRSQVYLAYMSCLYVTMTAYRARYRMCPQDKACTEEAPEGGDKMDIRSMSGLFVSVAVVMFAALVYSFVEKGDLLASLQAARRAARGQPHTPHLSHNLGPGPEFRTPTRKHPNRPNCHTLHHGERRRSSVPLPLLPTPYANPYSNTYANSHPGYR